MEVKGLVDGDLVVLNGVVTLVLAPRETAVQNSGHRLPTCTFLVKLK